jgi:hypothetical protein
MRRPLDEIVASKGQGEFLFDPENGGGRRRRIKTVSRFEMISAKHVEEEEDDNPKDEPVWV